MAKHASSRAQINREINEVLARKPGGKIAKARNRPQITDCPCVTAGECNCHRMHITERCECPACKEVIHATIAKSRPWQGKEANERLDPRSSQQPVMGALDQALLDAFDFLDSHDGANYVLVYDLRRALPQVSRSVFDFSLNNLRRMKILTMDSADGRHVRLSDAQRDAGIREAGTNLVYVARR